jgi:ABC-2 type transport system ATP-binding protein
MLTTTNPAPPSTSAPHVIVDGLVKRFGSNTALAGCSLQIGRGEVFGLLGPNGAGKSTLIQLLMGFLRPTAGAATSGGRDCHRERVAVHREVAYLPADARLFRSMNGRQVLRFFARVRPDGNLERSCALAARLDLDLRRWVAFMSTGMRQKLALAAVLSLAAPLTILDEPTANLDPTVRQTVLDVIRELRASGQTVLFSSHVLGEVEDVCDRVAILRSGRIVHEQSMAALRGQYRISGTYRGEATGELAGQTDFIRHDATTGELLVAVSGDIRPVLGWLARHEVTGIAVHRAGLADVYRAVHGAPEVEA